MNQFIDFNGMSIGIHVSANSLIGTGHLHRQLSLINEVNHLHKISFYFLEIESELIEKIIKTFDEFEKIRIYKFNHIVDNKYKNLYCLLDKNKHDIIINDILDTEARYMSELKKRGFFIVNFEDRGNGICEADLVFNDMYGVHNSGLKADLQDKICVGHEYSSLKRELKLYKYRRETFGDIQNILITFGGTDPQNYTLMILMTLLKLNINENINITVILGLGYNHKKQIIDLCESNNIKCYSNVRDMPGLMRNCEAGITSNGRTLLEFAYLGIPCISIAQNEREKSHIFAKESNGVFYLGGQGDEHFNTEFIENSVKKFIFNQN